MFSNHKLPAALIFFTIIAGVSALCLFNAPWPAASAPAKELNISPGMSFLEITNQLAGQGVIRSKIVFGTYALITRQAFQFKPGRYFLEVSVSLPKLAEILKNGPRETSVVIIPGMTVKEIDDKLSSLKIIKSGELINFDAAALKEKYKWFLSDSLEGFLFPDTYNFFAASNVNSIVKAFLDNFTLKVLPFFNDYDNLSKIVNIASILEKEVPDYNDRRLITGILKKRLSVGMPLQVDAALVYFKCSGDFLNCAGLGLEDYKTDSPYNTYIHSGLPKTAIGNPSAMAIKAALFPLESDYWYYLSDPQTKKTIFSETLDGQNENRAKYLLNK